MKKILIFILALCMLGVGSAGFAEAEMEGNMYLTGLPIVKETEDLHLFIVQPDGYPSGFEGMKMNQRFAEETNLNIIWDTVPIAAWAERKAIMIASNDLPDVIAGGGVTDDEMLAWGEQGLLVELTPLIENYMPRLQQIFSEYPEYRQQITLGTGQIYGFFHTADIDFGMRGNILYVNQDWLDAAGIDYTFTQHKLHKTLDNDLTLEEFERILLAFKDAMPEGYPLTTTYDSSSPTSAFRELYGAFGMVDPNDVVPHVVVEDGKAIFVPAQPQFKEAVSYFAKLYAQGLIDPEIFTQTYSTYLAKLQQEPSMNGFALMWTAHQVDNNMGELYDKWLVVKPLIGFGGEREWERTRSAVGKGIYCITSACKNPAVAARFQDYLYDEDNSYQLSMGNYGESLIKNDDGTLDMLEYMATDPTNLNMLFIGTPEMYSRVNFADPTQMTIDVGMEMRPYQPDESQLFPVIAFSKEATELRATLEAELRSFVSQKQAAWITGAANIDDEWDAYLQELDMIGLIDLMEVYQSTLDAMPK